MWGQHYAGRSHLSWTTRWLSCKHCDICAPRPGARAIDSGHKAKFLMHSSASSGLAGKRGTCTQVETAPAQDRKPFWLNSASPSECKCASAGWQTHPASHYSKYLARQALPSSHPSTWTDRLKRCTRQNSSPSSAGPRAQGPHRVTSLKREACLLPATSMCSLGSSAANLVAPSFQGTQKKKTRNSRGPMSRKIPVFLSHNAPTFGWLRDITRKHDENAGADFEKDANEYCAATS